MTFNQLINHELIDFLTATKKSFIEVMNDSRKNGLDTLIGRVMKYLMLISFSEKSPSKKMHL